MPPGGGSGGAFAPPEKLGVVGGRRLPTCYRVKVLHQGTHPCIPITWTLIFMTSQRRTVVSSLSYSAWFLCHVKRLHSFAASNRTKGKTVSITCRRLKVGCGRYQRMPLTAVLFSRRDRPATVLVPSATEVDQSRKAEARWRIVDLYLFFYQPSCNFFFTDLIGECNGIYGYWRWPKGRLKGLC